MSYYAEQFVINNNLRPADAILLKKKFMGMVNHYAVFLGRHSRTNRPVFAANYTGGVQTISDREANEFLQTLVPEKIDRFRGSSTQRQNAVQRAISMIGKKGYNLITYNCEHYKNFIQFNRKYSEQVDVAGKSAMVLGGAAAIAGLASENNKVTAAGLILLALGGLASGAADQDS